jgi:superoxide reductase
MDPDHWIEFLWAKDQTGALVAGVNLASTDKPELTFDIPSGATAITAFEFCNKHGVWKSDDVSSA